MKYFLSALFTFICFTGIAIGQANLKSAYIITLKGDTVHGFINAKDWSMNPSIINFKQSANDDGVYYDPYDIRMFSMEGDIYEGGLVDVENSSRSSSSYSTSPELFLQKQLVFLQLLTTGSRSLYVNGNAAGQQFYIKNDTTYELLVYKQYLKDVIVAGQTQTTLVKNNAYQSQLMIYLGDCPEIPKLITKTRYQMNSLKTLFRKYYECKNEENQVLNPKLNFRALGGLGVGVMFTSMNFGFVYNNKNAKPVKITAIPISISLELIKPITMPKWSLFNELSYAIVADQELYQEFTESETDYKEAVLFETSSIKLDNMVRYYIPLEKMSIFVSGGLSNQLYKGSRESILTATILGTKIDKKNYKKIMNWIHRPAISAGLSVGRWSFEGKYAVPIRATISSDIISFSLNYRFSKK